MASISKKTKGHSGTYVDYDLAGPETTLTREQLLEARGYNNKKSKKKGKK